MQKPYLLSKKKPDIAVPGPGKYTPKTELNIRGQYGPSNYQNTCQIKFPLSKRTLFQSDDSRILKLTFRKSWARIILHFRSL